MLFFVVSVYVADRMLLYMAALNACPVAWPYRFGADLWQGRILAASTLAKLILHQSLFIGHFGHDVIYPKQNKRVNIHKKIKIDKSKSLRGW
jgi:hypothetical protein